MSEEEDDLYGGGTTRQTKEDANGTAETAEGGNDEVEMENDEEDESEEESDSDIEFITERKEAPAPEPSSRVQEASISKLDQRETAAQDAAQTAAAPSTTATTTETKRELPTRLGTDFPEIRSSSIDVNAVPTWGDTGKPITEIDVDADLAEHTKPWRLPGADQSDYFNYGFDEFTWTTYCLKQRSMTGALAEQKAETAKFEMMFGGGMPGMPGMPSGAGAAPPQQQAPPQAASQGMGMGGMPGMPGMSDDMMQQMMATLMQQGITDPSQLDFGTFMNQMQQMQGPPGGGAGGGGGMGQNIPQGPAAQQGGAYGQGQGNWGGGGGGGRRGRGRW